MKTTQQQKTTLPGKPIKLAAATLGLAVLTACGGEAPSTTAIEVATTPPVSAETNAVTAAVSFDTQADSGAGLYELNCAVCHGANLEGTTLGPLLSGSSFIQRWGGQTPALLLGNIRANMPPGGNESLTEGNYIDIVAHILSVNGVDSVVAALTAEPDFEISDNISQVVARRERSEPPAQPGPVVHTLEIYEATGDEISASLELTDEQV